MTDETSDGSAMTVTNEYARVRLRKVLTRNGERLHVQAPLSGNEVMLDAVVLESLAAYSAEELSRLVASAAGS